jgi:SAM-dependent methyltransferase
VSDATRPQADGSPIANRYTDGTYAAATQTWHDEDAPFKARWLADFLTAQGTQPDTICDVGCGAGGVLAGLRSEFPLTRLVGYEISEDAVSLAHEWHPEVEVRLGDVRETQETFDLVLMMDVFEHVEDYLGFLRGLAGLGQLTAFHVPLDMTALMVAREQPIMRARRLVGHLHYFSKATALATLNDAGYEVLATRYTPATMEVPNRNFKMRVAAWPRKAGMRLAPDLTVRTLGGYSMLILARPRGSGRSGEARERGLPLTQ